jgi:undecaprenyl-diphosphatase
MIDEARAAALGLVQGLTEFFPISSSGHLILWRQLWGWTPLPPAFDAFLHLGTLGAVLWVERRQLVYLCRFSAAASLAWRRTWRNLFLAALPLPFAVAGAGLVASFWQKESQFLSLAFAITAAVLLAGEWGAVQRRDIAQLRWWEALGIGLTQLVALIPGLSRAGLTISLGLLWGLRRTQATHFSFLLSLPAIGGAGLWAAGEAAGGNFETSWLALLTGALMAAASGIFAMQALLRWVRKHSFLPFSLYLLLLAALVWWL